MSALLDDNASSQRPAVHRNDVRMRGFKDRADVDEVLRLIAQRVLPLPVERVPLGEAAGRVLAEHVTATVAVPCFDRSAMDGYAVRGEETFGASAYNPIAFKVIEESLPGRPFAGHLGPGEAVRIMTGAPIPVGADAVVMAEHTRTPLTPPPQGGAPASSPGGHVGGAPWQSGEIVEVTEAVPPGRHIGRRGEDIASGSVVLHAPRRLRPQDVGVLSSIGLAEVPVFRRPRVRIVITGAELLPAGSAPDPKRCRIADSNSVMLAALVRRDGGIPYVLGPLPDDREAIRKALLHGDTDCILVSGGSSVGAEDHAPTLVAELGELPVHGVAMRPSSPAGVGFVKRWDRMAHEREGETRGQGGKERGEVAVFLLPGNPVSCLCAYDFFAGPAIRRLGGGSMDWPYRSVTLSLGRKISSAVGRVDYVRVGIEEERVVPISTSGASILSSTTRADGFVVVVKDSEGHAVGQKVRVYLYD